MCYASKGERRDCEVRWYRVALPGGKVIKSLQQGESYKYLGILEADFFSSICLLQEK